MCHGCLCGWVVVAGGGTGGGIKVTVFTVVAGWGVHGEAGLHQEGLHLQVGAARIPKQRRQLLLVAVVIIAADDCGRFCYGGLS